MYSCTTYEHIKMKRIISDETRNSSSDSSLCDENQPLSPESLDDLYQGQTQLNERPENTQVAQSWENLQEVIVISLFVFRPFFCILGTPPMPFDLGKKVS